MFNWPTCPELEVCSDVGASDLLEQQTLMKDFHVQELHVLGITHLLATASAAGCIKLGVSFPLCSVRTDHLPALPLCIYTWSMQQVSYPVACAAQERWRCGQILPEQEPVLNCDVFAQLSNQLSRCFTHVGPQLKRARENQHHGQFRDPRWGNFERIRLTISGEGARSVAVLGTGSSRHASSTLPPSSFSTRKCA